MRSVVRWIGIGCAALLPVLAGAVPAQAKLPPFTIEWSPQTPAPGEVVRFTVRFWDDVEHTDRARWPSMRSFDDLVRLFPALKRPADVIQVDLALVRPGVYRGETTLPSAGRWTVCTWDCPAGGGSPGYPDRLSLAVVAAPSAATALAPDGDVVATVDDGGHPALIAAASLTLAVVAGGAARRARRRVAPRPPTPRPLVSR
jgi:hypothetical protein